MRLAMEEVLYDNGVDIVLNGHCHEYERSNPVYVSLHPVSVSCMHGTDLTEASNIQNRDCCTYVCTAVL